MKPVPQPRSGRRCGGFTLGEVVVSTLITSFVLGGTMTAFLTAARIDSATGSAKVAEAAGYAEDWLEALRNRVAADDPFFLPQALGGQAGRGWIDDEPRTNPPPPATEIVRRVYRVDARDCDGDGVLAGVVPAPGAPREADCYAVTVRVCWNQSTCP